MPTGAIFLPPLNPLKPDGFSWLSRYKNTVNYPDPDPGQIFLPYPSRIVASHTYTQQPHTARKCDVIVDCICPILIVVTLCETE